MAATSYPPEIVAAMGGREPTEEQWRAISWPLEPCVLVAGAGSGKTSVMAARVVYLALVALGRMESDHAGVLPGNVLCLTFTHKATENLTLRVRSALSAVHLPEGEEPEIANYHSFAAQVLDRYGLLSGIEPGQRVLTPAQRNELCNRVLDEMPFELVKTEWQPSVVAKILELADQCQNHFVDPAEVISFNEQRLRELANHRSDRAYQSALERIELAKGAQVFERLKRERGLIDFGDQISLALKVLQDRPEVGHEYRAAYAAVLLDEYQDTNVAQARLLSALFGDGHPVTAVGDPDQNIYAWRGASLFNLLQFPSSFLRSDGSPAARLPLYTNFRSGARILKAADQIITEVPVSQRPDPEKQLEPWGPNGEGVVAAATYLDEWAEAEDIADRITALHLAGEPWSGCAVLCRTSRLFFSLQQAFAERDVPVEIVGLAGLLKLPEVVEVLSYARAVADPFASVALARILLGPRYRVGYKDLARVAAWTKSRNYEWLQISEDAEEAPFLLAEALEHLDEVEYLSEEGRQRLEEFREELAELRQEARRSVGEFLAEVVRRVGILDELDALPDPAVAAATKRNLGAFLDEVHSFLPVEGELTLRAFLDYVDTVDRMDRPEWSPVQPSDEDSVKVMTIHAAKGLEFDTVFVPGMATDLLPNTRIQHNPAERGKSLDFELRGDAEILPKFDGVLSHFKEALRAQEIVEERRTCYVALTRARRRLFCSAAHWYSENQKPKGAGQFLVELMTLLEANGLGDVTPGPEVGEENPLIGHKERFVRDWPGPARPRDDALFPQGWRRAALDAATAGSVPPSLADRLDASEREAYRGLAANRRALARTLLEREAPTERGAGIPTIVSVGGLVDYGRCPKRFYWGAVRPLPRFSGPAARIGTEIHAWIERRSSGQATLIELDEEPDLTSEELAGQPGKVKQLRDAFLASRFATMVPLHAERPFMLSIGGFMVRGRIDAVYGTDGGPWEIVDYKTGRRPDGDPLSRIQLDLYALACVDVWGKRPEDLTLTYLYLATGEEESFPASEPGAIRDRVAGWLSAIGSAQFEPTPGQHCRWCDFLSFCEPGRTFVRSEGA
jgi:DNA helicase-2/ATP-dependent DNA helicase PcrA